MTIEQFRRKYGAYSARLEEDLAFIIQQDMENYETVSENEDLLFIIMNPELAAQFVDYTKVIGKFNDMFFLSVPSGIMFYAYDERGKQNIIKKVSDIAASYRSKAIQLETILDCVR